MSKIYIDNPIEIENGGLFISNGTGIHPKRIISSFELIFVYQGNLEIQEAEFDYRLKTGDLLLLHPNVEHQGIVPYETNTKFYWVHFRLSKFSKTSSSHTFIDLVKLSHVDDLSKISSLFNLLLHEQDLGMDKTTLNIILLLLIKEISSKNTSDHKIKPVNLAYRADSLIRRFYRDAITPSHIAQKLQCNVDYLGRVFKDTFQETLSQSIQNKKIYAAKRDLVELNLTIDVIAKQLGFRDSGYFRRVFIKHVGMKPSDYRKLYSIRSMNAE